MGKAANSNLWNLFCFIFLSLRFVLCISHLHFILLTLMLLFVILGWALLTGKSTQKDLHFWCACHCLWSPFLKNCCFIHRCGKEWKGNRCHISAKPLQPPSLLQNGRSVKRKKYLSVPSLSVSFYLFLSLIALILQIFGLGCVSVSCWLKLQLLPCISFRRRKCQERKWNFLFCVKQTQMWHKAMANCPVSLVSTFKSPHSLYAFICHTRHKTLLCNKSWP